MLSTWQNTKKHLLNQQVVVVDDFVDQDYNSSSIIKQAELNQKGTEAIVAEVEHQLKKEKEKCYSYK